jgi:predicted MFS family arabinose efflux permease
MFNELLKQVWTNYYASKPRFGEVANRSRIDFLALKRKNMGFFKKVLPFGSPTRSSDDLSNLAKAEKTFEGKVEIYQDLESISSDGLGPDHIFRDPAVAEHYRKVYESTNYECKDYVDHDLTWTPKEERKITWKNEWYVTFWAFVMFTALDIDRGNMAQALSDNFLENLNLDTNDFNLGHTIFLVCFLSAELPSQLVSKWIGPDIWIPTQMILWSIVSVSQAALKNKAGFFITRGLLGALQGGFIPDVCLWLSYFYTSKELPLRMSLFYIANPLSQVWSSLLAFALLEIKTDAIKEGWRWLFLIEGIVTLLIGIVSFFKMPASVVQTKSWYRKKGWYTDREEKILVNKVLRDDPAKGDMNNRQPVGPKELLRTLMNYDLWPIYLVRLLGDIGSGPTGRYLTLSLRTMGFSTFKTNALTIPHSIFSIFTMVIATHYSEVLNQRALSMAITPIWVITCLFPLRYWKGTKIATLDVWGTYALLTVLLSQPTLPPISITWCSANSNSVRDRAVSAALVNIFSQTASLCSAYIYRKDDAPDYKRGNVQLIGIAFGALGMCLVAKGYYILRNKQKSKKWDAMSEDQRQAYIETTTDEGNKRLDFRFVH